MQSLPRWMENRVLVTALAISVGLHAVVLAIRFVDPELLEKISFAPPIEVILVNARSERRPAQAQARAQVNLEGGGTNEQGRRSSPLPDIGQVIDGDALEAARRNVARLEQEQRALLAALDANRALATSPARPDSAASREEVRQSQAQLARMQAEIAKEVSDYQKRPRVHHFMPSTSEYRFARYFEDWRARVEKIGNEHYPEAARGRIYGSLRMTVVIAKDGSLIAAIIEDSSGSEVLDSAARRIVKLSAPFPPFPPEMARDTDRLEITRSWIFTNDQFATRAEPGGSGH
jgi:periplasmic protein TonB